MSRDPFLPNDKEDRLAQLREQEAIIEKIALAPPRCGGVVFPAPDPLPVITSEQRLLLSERVPPEKCWTVFRWLLWQAASAWNLLREPSGGMRERDKDRWERLAVGAILCLWKTVPAGRAALQAWGEGAIAARWMRSCETPLGVYESAAHACQDLGETVLAEIWRVARKTEPLSKDDAFEAGSELPRFDVDAWYSALSLLHQFFKPLRDRWGLKEGPNGRTLWDVALTQELAAIRQQQRTLLPTNAKTPATKETPTDARGHWMYEQRLDGKSFKAIVYELNRIADKHGWEPLDSEPAAATALRRWCKKHDKNYPNV